MYASNQRRASLFGRIFGIYWMGEAEDADDASKRVQDEMATKRFAVLVATVGGSTAAARAINRSRNAIEKWASGKSRIPFADYLALSMHADQMLDRPAATSEKSPAAHVLASSDGAALPPGYVTVPTFDVRASAGSGAITLAAKPIESEIVAFSEAWLRALGFLPGRVHIVWASGDSMLPTIRDGDMLLVDRTIDRVLDAGIYIVVVAGAVVVKRLTIRTNGSVVLRSDNSLYPEETVPADEVPSLIVEGRVRWVGGPI